MNGIEPQNINDTEMDVLREIANIGAGHAATALADMLAHRISMEVPSLQLLPVDSLVRYFGSPEKEVVGIVFEMQENVKGNILYIIEKQFCHSLLHVLTGKDVNQFEDMDPMDLSALTEIGNIVVGSYISAMAETSGLVISITPPVLAVDMLGAILNYPLQFFGTRGDQVLFIEDTFTGKEEQVVCHLLVMPEPESLSVIMRQLGIEHG